MKIAVIAAAACLGACAATAQGGQDNVAPPPGWLDGSAGSFEGWVRITGEEFRLYEKETDLNAGLSPACVSGALPRNPQRAAGDLNGQKVRFLGRTGAWADRDGPQTYNWQGSRISNPCRRDVVILAERVEVLR